MTRSEIMIKVYECELTKQNELKKILEADPYSQDSFARVGYKLKDGAMVGEDKAKVYLYTSASDDFVKIADEKLKGIATPAKKEVSDRVTAKIVEEEDSVAAGVAFFGE